MGFGFATCAKVLKEAKRGIRVSDKATLLFAEALDEIAKGIADEAKNLAEHANRRTIMEQDVKLALKVLGKRKD